MQPGRWRLDLFSRSSGLPQPSTCRPTDSISAHNELRNRSSSSTTYTREVMTSHSKLTRQSTSFLWQDHLHAGAGFALATGYASVVQPNDVAGDRKSQATALHARGDERFEDPVENRVRNADAVIQDLDRYFGQISGQDSNGHQAPGDGRNVERRDAVDDEIVQGGLKQFLDTLHANERRADFEPDLDLLAPGERLHASNGVAADFNQVHAFVCGRLVLGEHAHALDDRRGADRFGFDHFEVIAQVFRPDDRVGKTSRQHVGEVDDGPERVVE